MIKNKFKNKNKYKEALKNAMLELGKVAHTFNPVLSGRDQWMISVSLRLGQPGLLSEF